MTVFGCRSLSVGNLRVNSDDFTSDDEPALVLEIEDSIDLHGFAPRDIPDVVADYLEAAAEKGFCEVRLIHGKGIGVQRSRVQQLLRAHPLVIDFRDAPASRGHWGATLVWLKRLEPALRHEAED